MNEAGTRHRVSTAGHARPGDPPAYEVRVTAPTDNPDGVAPVNRPHACEVETVLGRLGRWLSRLTGQVRRQYLSRLFPGYVYRSRQRRRGACRRCGACCDLTFHCPYLDEDRRCTHYERRPLTCRDFPIDTRDLRLTRVPCGHYFGPLPEGSGLRIPLAPYGRREVILFGGAALAGLALSAAFFWYAAPVFALGLAFVLYFFRDPARCVPDGDGVLVAPADGTVVEVGRVEGAELAGLPAPVSQAIGQGPVHRIAIFMSPLDVHVNRSPCEGRVESVVHRPGRFHNARTPEASAENESTTVALADIEGGAGRVVVRQVAGVLARRIVCDASVGNRLKRGQRFGMIKFGSRAEVYVPRDAGFSPAVDLGSRVRAGETILGTIARTEE